MQPHDTTPHKVCTKCGESKPATTEYFARDNRKTGALRPCCKDCLNRRSRTHYQTNKDEYAKRHREYYLANGGTSDYDRAYREANKEKIDARLRQWKASNQPILKAAKHRRRTREYNAEGTHTAADITAQYKAQKGRCHYAACGHSKLGDTYHIDHIVPLSRGGSNWPENIVLTCPRCNLSKGDKLPHEWAEGGRLL